MNTQYVADGPILVARTQKVNSAPQDCLRPMEDMETKADLRTRGGRVQHVRLALATRYGNVSLEKFGALVAAEQQALTGEAVKPYVSSTVMRWEAGADLFLGPALAIASLGAVSVEWIALGDAKRTRKAPTPEQESRTKVAKGVVSQRPEQRQRKKN